MGLVPAGAGLALIVSLLVLLDPLCNFLGGALFNPANNATFYALGQGSLFEHLCRMLGQCAGAATGVAISHALLPYAWQKGLHSYAVGLRPGVSLVEGAACELVLGMLLAFLVVSSARYGGRFWKTWLPLMATVLAVKGGESYTGPSLNPAVTFGWSLAYPSSNTLEHCVVFWVAPLLSGVMGGWCYQGMRLWVEQQQVPGTQHRQQHDRREQERRLQKPKDQ